MKLKYYKEDDLLVINFSDKPVDDSFMIENSILEVSKDKEPVNLEILHASKFFDAESKAIPKEVKEEFFAPV